MTIPKRVSEPREATCWTLLRSAAEGSQDAASEFHATYERVVRSFLLARWRGRKLVTEVEDAIQEVFVACLKPDGALSRADRGLGSFRGYLYSVTRNVARRLEKQALAHKRLKQADTGWVQALADDEPGQVTLFDRNWAQALIQEAHGLYGQRAKEDGADAQRRFELLQRRFGNGEAIRTIAAEWQVPAQDLHNAYRKARQEFYTCLKEVVAFHSPSAQDVDAECRALLGQLG